MNKNVEKAAIALKVGDEKGWTAAEALWKANKEDGLNQREISAQLTDRLGSGYSLGTVSRYITVWERNRVSARKHSFTEAYFEIRHENDGREGIANREARKVLRERPEVIAEELRESPGEGPAIVASAIISTRPEKIAEAIAKAPKEIQAKIADELIKAPETERSLKTVVTRSMEPPPTPIKPKAEAKIHDGVFRLWETSELLMDEAPTGEERLRIKQSAEKAMRLALGILNLIETGQVEDEFRSVLDEVGSEA